LLQLLYLLGLIVAANGCIVLAVVYPSHAAVIVVGYLLCMFLCAVWVSQSLKLSSKEMFALKVSETPLGLGLAGLGLPLGARASLLSVG